MPTPSLLALAALAAALPALAAETPARPRPPPRSMQWTSVEAQARLDAQGTLRVVERQVLLLDGDWTGPERRFRLGPGQQLDAGAPGPASTAPGGLTRSRLARSARPITTRGATPARCAGPAAPRAHRRTGRRRSRTSWPTASPACCCSSRTAPTGWPMTSACRSGPACCGTCAPRWRSSRAGRPPEGGGAAPPAVEERELAPGTGAELRVALRWTGPQPAPQVARRLTAVAERPGGPLDRPEPPEPLALGAPAFAPEERLALRAGLVLALLLITAAIALQARARGAFARGPAPDQIDAAWLEQRLFSRPPEAIGAAWDPRPEGAARSAALARLQLAGTIAVRAAPDLHLRLLVDRAELPQADRALVATLFPSGETTTGAELRHATRPGAATPCSDWRWAWRRSSSSPARSSWPGGPPRWPCWRWPARRPGKGIRAAGRRAPRAAAGCSSRSR
ncbi:MAG: hypothetical protein QM767_29200 [Anaeromyxobacter sp.]